MHMAYYRTHNQFKSKIFIIKHFVEFHDYYLMCTFLNVMSQTLFISRWMQGGFIPGTTIWVLPQYHRMLF